MIKFSILLCICTLYLTSCSRHKYGESDLDNSLQTLQIDIRNADKYSYQSIVDTGRTEFIQLETTRESMLGRHIDKFYVDNNKFIFLSDNRIIVFSIDGKHLFTISKIGKGPGEYHTLSDIGLYEECIYAMDYRRNRILRYSQNGEYLSSLVLKDLSPRSFYIIDKDVYSFHNRSFITQKSRTRINLYSIAKNKVIDGRDVISNKEAKWLYMFEPNIFTKRENDILLNYACNDTIYRIIENSIKPFILLDWGAFALPKEVKNDDYIDIVDFYNKNHKKYIYHTLGMYSTNSHLTFGIRLNEQVYQIVYNWESEKAIIIDGIDNLFYSKNKIDKQRLFLPRASDNEYHYLMLEHYFIEDEFTGPNVPPILKTIDENKNPIIVKIKYKI